MTIATELGGWLRAANQCTSITRNEPAPPSNHRLFSHPPWTTGLPASADNVLTDDEDMEVGGVLEEDTRNLGALNNEQDGDGCWWMAADDIEEVN